jgi:hypothetical protein
MKRYDPRIIHKEGCGHIFHGWEESLEGDWVVWNDVKREYSLCEDTITELQEVNKKVLELLIELQNIVFLSRNNELHTQIYKAIAKMRGDINE